MGSASSDGHRLGEVLVNVGYLSLEQLMDALAAQEANPGRRLGEVLLDLGFLTSGQLERGLALQAIAREIEEKRRSRSKVSGKR